MSRCYRCAIAVAAALAFASPASAQGVPAGDVGAAPTPFSMRASTPVTTFAPVLAIQSTLVTEVATVPAPMLFPPPAMRRSQSVALMIVGGAGMIVGSLINGDTGTIIMAGPD